MLVPKFIDDAVDLLPRSQNGLSLLLPLRGGCGAGIKIANHYNIFVVRSIRWLRVVKAAKDRNLVVDYHHLVMKLTESALPTGKLDLNSRIYVALLDAYYSESVQRLIFLSKLPDANSLPFGEKLSE